MSNLSQQKVAFVGLGVMGFPMAGHLQQKGEQVCVYNRTHQKALDWVQQYGGTCASTPADAATGADLVMLCVGNDNDVRSVVYGEQGVLAAMRPGSLLIDHTTASADLARELALACKAKGIGFLDAPVSGGQAGAQNGLLTIMLGGEIAEFAKAENTLMKYARSARLLGPAGSGQLAKMVNQICIAGVVQGLAEAMHFAQQAGLDGQAVLDTISKGAAQSWQMENRGSTMLQGKYDFGFAVDWMRKDLAITLNEARHNGATLPLTALVDQFYAQVQAMGGGRWDTSSLLTVLQRKS
ncbi:NAD(P)-dependent oxidoreductase [Rheinheimera sp. 1928-s]|uniref:NAD(P)-dependent oxidoreductase n=1 Tax=Rheinheimera sp. 1928-s TaxID=3033803 RepID=UPI002608DAB6|nr:NAD(P)-dependent oxidoreductase [Rheinheimera sp. 1928-s]MDF3127376.1 NAD(P)-dependent oxidoreductase [Rheinheimera sp. 1928-s]